VRDHFFNCLLSTKKHSSFELLARNSFFRCCKEPLETRTGAMLNWANVYLLSGAMLNWTNVSSLFLSHLVYSRRCLALVFFCVTLSPWWSLVCLHHQNSFDMDTAPASMPWLASRCGSPTYAGPGSISYRKKIPTHPLIRSDRPTLRPWRKILPLTSSERCLLECQGRAGQEAFRRPLPRAPAWA
jgi:hypothetical protein